MSIMSLTYRVRQHLQHALPRSKANQPGLTEARLSKWTTITTDELLLTQLLEPYLLHNNPFFTFFQADIFLVDLEIGKKQFCSSPLVNAVLASATHSRPSTPGRNGPWNTQGFLLQVLPVALRLWELENGECKLTTLQAALIANSIYNLDGLDQIGNIYMIQAAKMVRNLNLPYSPKNRHE